MILRYHEHDRYDVTIDGYVTRMMATGDRGTWWAELELGTGTPLREKREFFKRYVAQAAKRGHPPCEVRL
jgi:hypothetical protein